MLAELLIENFAIIDSLLLRLSPGFTVLTGETGAGKSIIIDALQAALGEKTSSEVVRDQSRSATVEAIFDISCGRNEGLESILVEYGVESGDQLILRREIGVSGRGTSRINGRALPLAALSAVGSLLVDIHGQSDHLSILKRDRQLDVLDRYGDLLPLRSPTTEAIDQYVHLKNDLDELTTGRREREQRLDLLRFQVHEIESAGLREGEEEDLSVERNLLVNAERLTQLSSTVHELVQGESRNLIEGLREAVTTTQELARIDPALSSLYERLQTAKYELEDIGQELRRYRDELEYDPARLDSIESRLDLLTRLKRKYGATIQDVINFGQASRAEMEGVESLDERLEELEEELAGAELRAADLANELSLARASAASRLNQAMKDELQGLALKGASFEVQVVRTPSQDGLKLGESVDRSAFRRSGIDTVSFLVSFNPGEPLRPFEKVASGGETSRFLLALKSILAKADQTPTLVFDEVDVGVGGRAAAKIGERLRDVSAHHQVLSITHLPQIAALADQHLTVTKSLAGGRTSVAVEAVENADRVMEIAEMMTGTGTETARRNAEELLSAARNADREV